MSRAERGCSQYWGTHGKLTGSQLTRRRDAIKGGAGQHPLVLQHKLKWPTDQLHGHYHQGPEGEQEGECDERLDDHEPAGQEPLTNHIVLVAEDVVAAVEGGRELVVRIPELFEAVLPQTHVFELAERFLVRGDPVRGAEGHQQEDPSHV